MSASERRARRGAQAEHHVAAVVEERGWKVIARNFRKRFGEIDLIAIDGDILVFIEVRARSDIAFGLADETVTRAKLQRVTSTAQAFIQDHLEYADSYWRVDLFALTMDRRGNITACRQYENLTLD